MDCGIELVQRAQLPTVSRKERTLLSSLCKNDYTGWGVWGGGGRGVHTHTHVSFINPHKIT